MKFSERMIFYIPQFDLQSITMSPQIKKKLWHLLYESVFERQFDDEQFKKPKTLFESIWVSHFKEPIEEMPNNMLNMFRELNKRFYNWKDYEVYDFIEFFVNELESNYFIQDCNLLFHDESIDYRFWDYEFSTLLFPTQHDIIVKHFGFLFKS